MEKSGEEEWMEPRQEGQGQRPVLAREHVFIELESGAGRLGKAWA